MSEKKKFKPSDNLTHMGKGRKKGGKNKFSGDIKQLIMDAVGDLETNGQGLGEWAKKHPSEFYKHILSKCIPKDINLSSQDIKDSLDMLINGVAGKTRDLPNRSQGKIRE